MSKATPGPWTVGGEWPQIVAVYDANHIYIAHAETGVGRDWIGVNPIGRERAKANAALIARAPALRDALRELTDAAERVADWSEPRVGAALIKAHAALDGL